MAEGRLAGELALVTGSTSGLGKVIARCFAGAGAAVCVTGRNEERGRSVVADIGGEGGRAFFVAADLESAGDCGRLVEGAASALGGLSILVNNAVASSVGGDGPVGELDPAAWERILQVNLGAAAFLSQAAIRHMRERGHGAIVNISSRAAERGTPRLAAYTASKGGLNALTRSIAVDYAADGIRCNTVQPGYVLHEHRDAELDTARRKRLAGMVLGDLGTAEDVALAALYLASRESAHVTGITLPVDGGSTASRGLVLG